jgi:Tfp pilus assembly protein PilN
MCFIVSRPDARSRSGSRSERWEIDDSNQSSGGAEGGPRSCGRRTRHHGRRGGRRRDLQNLVLAALLIAVLVGFGGFFFWVKSRVTRLEKDIRTADAELARLAEIHKKMDEYTKQKDLLERKVNLITQLKKNQQVPVHLLDQISRNLPDFLWLENLRQDPNNHLVITARRRPTTPSRTSTTG